MASISLFIALIGSASLLLLTQSLRGQWTILKKKACLYTLLGVCVFVIVRESLSWLRQVPVFPLNGAYLILLLFSMSWSYHFFLVALIVKQRFRHRRS